MFTCERNYQPNRNGQEDQYSADQHKANQLQIKSTLKIRSLPEKIGGLAFESKKLVREGMFQHDELGVETEPAKGVATGAIAVVACHRVMRCGELRADLVLAAGLEGEFEECVG